MLHGSRSPRATACDHRIDHGINLSTYESGNEIEIVKKVNILRMEMNTAQQAEQQAKSDVSSRFLEKEMAERVCEFIGEIIPIKWRPMD